MRNTERSKSFHHRLRGRWTAALLGLTCLCPVYAQDDCSTLNIVGVQYGAFHANTISVDVHDPSSFGFVSPIFTLVAANGDTLAREVQYWFGIGSGPTPQRHHLELLEGALLPATPFTGSLVLDFTALNGYGQCVFPLVDVDLCPPGPCQGLQPYVHNTGQAVVTDFNWWITDAQDNIVGNGVLDIDLVGFPFAIDSLCLPPGPYVLHMEESDQSNADLVYGLRKDFLVPFGLEADFSAGSENQLPFVFHIPCATGVNGIAEHGVPELQVTISNGVLHMNTGNGTPLGLVELLCTNGRSVASQRSTSSNASLSIQGLATGIYLLRSAEHGTAQRVHVQGDR